MSIAFVKILAGFARRREPQSPGELEAWVGWIWTMLISGLSLRSQDSAGPREQQDPVGRSNRAPLNIRVAGKRIRTVSTLKCVTRLKGNSLG